MIVVDTNIIGYLYLTSDHSEKAEQALFKDSHWVAPLLWRSEFLNVLAQYIRKNIFSLVDAIRVMEEASALMHGREYETTSLQVLQLVTKSVCSAYDCEFVALAQDLDIPLITLDKQLLHEFPAHTVSLDAFVK